MTARPASLWSIVCLAAAAGLGAQPLDADRFYGQRLREVRFEPIVDKAIVDSLSLRSGEPLTREGVKQAIEQLFRTGRFVNIVVEASPTGADEADLVIRTELDWFIGRVVFEGVADPPSTGQLANAVKLDLGQPFAEGPWNQAVESIEASLRLNGLYQAKIEREIRRDPSTQSADLFFRIDAGPRARFAKPRYTGISPISPGRLTNASNWERWWGWFGWKTMTQQRVQTGVDRIRRAYLKSNYLMAKVSLDGMVYQPKMGTVTPLLTLEPGPRVDVKTVGAKLSKGRMRTLVPIYQEQSVDRSLLLEGQRNIQDYFQAQGYFDAAATFDIRDEADRKVIEYSIERGVRHKLLGLSLDGNRYFDAKTLLERMQITPATLLRYRRGKFGSRLIEQDEASIKDLYRSNGFLDVQVSHTVTENVGGKPANEAIRFDIAEGPQWLVSQVVMEGCPPDRAEGLKALLQTQEGQPYSEQSVGADRDTILNEYFNNGFSAASVESFIQPETGLNRILVRFNISEGRQLFVRDIRISGLKTTDRKLVERRLQLVPGDPLSQGAMLETQRRLYDLGIFSRVDVAVQNPDGMEASKLVLYEVEEARRWSLNSGLGAEIARIGGGITSFDSPAGGTGFSPRISLGVTRSNLFGVGHTTGVQGRLSNIQRRVLATYLAPQFRSSDRLNLTFNALFDDSRNVRTFNARRWETAAQLGQRLTRANSIQYRLTYRRVGVDGNTLKIEPQLIPLLSQPVRLGIASITFIQDRRDDPADAKRGWYSTVDTALSSRAFTSQSDFWRFLGRNSSYHRLTRDVVLARTLTAGWQYSLSAVPSREVPLPERFFSGGANSHRGFPENQAGPRDLVTGFPVGGKALIIASTEVRFPLIGDNLGGVLFHDMGNVFRNLSSVSFRTSQRNIQDFEYMVHTFGIGFRYRTPVGPIRLDLGYNANSPRFQGFQGTREDLLFRRGVATLTRVTPFQFHFSLGQAF